MKITIKFCIFELEFLPDWSLSWQFLVFWANFWSKTEKVSTLCIFKSVYVSKFSLNWQFWFFGQNLPKNKVFFGQKQKMSSLNRQFWFFFNQISLKRNIFLVLNREKVKITTTFCIFELDLAWNFSLN